MYCPEWLRAMVRMGVEIEIRGIMCGNGRVNSGSDHTPLDYVIVPGILMGREGGRKGKDKGREGGKVKRWRCDIRKIVLDREGFGEGGREVRKRWNEEQEGEEG